MAYVTQDELKGRVPAEYLTGALDDDGSGEADAARWANVSDDVDQEIDGRLGARYQVPLSPAPAAVSAAARCIAAFFLYARRGVNREANPWTEQADYWFAKLDKIGRGEEPLTYDKDSEKGPVLISEESKTHSANGHLMS